MSALVPKGTVAFAYIRDVKRLAEALERIAAVTGTKGRRGGKVFDLALLARQARVDMNDFDLDRPLGIAITQSASSMTPGMTALLPVREEKAFVRKIKGSNPSATVETLEGYAALTSQGAYSRGGPPTFLDAPIPEGDFVIRLDVAALWKKYGPMASSLMEQDFGSGDGPAEPDGNPVAMLKPMIDGLEAVVEATSTCDVAMCFEGTEIQVDVTIRFANDAKVPFCDVFSRSDLATLARAIPDEGMMSMAMTMNPEKLLSSFEPFAKASLEQYPESARAVMAKAYETVAGGVKALGNGMAVSGGFKDGRVEMIGAMNTSDPVGCIKTMIDLTTALPSEGSPISVEPPEERTVAGTKVTTVRFKFDPEKMPSNARTAASRDMMAAMVGKDHLRYHFVPLENRLVFVIGGEHLLERVIQMAKAGADAPETPLSKALAAAGADTVGYLRMDLEAMMRETAAIASRTARRRAPKVPAPGEPIPLVCILNVGSGEVRGRISVDVGRIAKLSASMLGK